jgi:hypothetical protein
VLAGIDGLLHADEHARNWIAVDLDGQIFGRVRSFHPDLDRCNLRIDSADFLLRRGLGVAKCRRSIGRQLFFDDAEVRFPRFDVLADLGMCARQVKKMWRRMHERFGSGEKIDGFLEATAVESCDARGGERTRTGALLVRLARGCAAPHAKRQRDGARRGCRRTKNTHHRVASSE